MTYQDISMPTESLRSMSPTSSATAHTTDERAKSNKYHSKYTQVPELQGYMRAYRYCADDLS